MKTKFRVLYPVFQTIFRTTSLLFDRLEIDEVTRLKPALRVLPSAFVP